MLMTFTQPIRPFILAPIFQMERIRQKKRGQSESFTVLSWIKINYVTDLNAEVCRHSHTYIHMMALKILYLGSYRIIQLEQEYS